ncbi:MAG: hypothetical protein ABIT07_09290 [Ferruginibacter sp.]
MNILYNLHGAKIGNNVKGRATANQQASFAAIWFSTIGDEYNLMLTDW